VSTFIIDTTAPTVVSVYPADNKSGVSITTDNISVTFSDANAMDNNSVTSNTSDTSCSGSFQLSPDNFSSCVQMSSSPSSSDNMTFEFAPSLSLFYSTNYKIRITTAARDRAGNVIASQDTQTNGFITTASIPITAGSAHSCFILDNGSVKCWGANASGQLGLGNTNNRGDGLNEMGDNLTAVDLGTGRTVRDIEAGDNHTCAILDNESVKCWGANASGQLGLGDTNNRGDASGEMGDTLLSVDLGTLRTAKAIASGYAHTCAILDNESVKCWGANTSGQLGLGNTNNRGDESSQMGDSLTAVDLGTGRTAKAIAAGYQHTCVILDNESVKCWGLNDKGQLGIGSNSGSNVKMGDGSGEMGDSLPAVDLGSGRTAKAISAGYQHTCVILDNASVNCWGNGLNGQLGRGENKTEKRPKSDPIDLGSGRNAKAIVTGNSHTCVMLDNSSTKCWGYNASGQLGLGDTINLGDGSNEMGDSLLSIDLGTGKTTRAISAGDSHTCSILDNSSIKCWGANASGQLGLGHTNNRGDNSSEMGDNLPVISL
jgi:alpha-tubulin suppressor-like RCC1 family protein